MPAMAGIQNYLKILDSRLRGNDVKGRFKTFYDTITVILKGANRSDVLFLFCFWFIRVMVYSTLKWSQPRGEMGLDVPSG